MKQDYQKMQEQILPGREKQDEIWNIIEKKAEERQGQFSRQYAVRLAGSIAAAILVCVLCLPQTGLADNIKGFLNQYFDKSANVKQDIVKNIYEDSDGHVKMQVTQMLSDGACAYLDICYKALDDTGKHWLSNAKFGTNNAINFLYKGDIVGKTNGYSSGLKEYKDMATEQERYFTFQYEDYSGNFNMNKSERILSYPMCKKKGEGKIKINSKTDIFAYRLEGKDSPSKFYEPQYLLVSKLSFGIFGKNQGVYTRISDKYGCREYTNEEFLSSPDSDDIPNVSFIMKDSSEIKFDGCAMSGFSPALNVPGYDLVVAAGHFYNEENSKWENHTTINPDELAGVEICGVYYDLVLDKRYK